MHTIAFVAGWNSSVGIGKPLIAGCIATYHLLMLVLAKEKRRVHGFGIIGDRKKRKRILLQPQMAVLWDDSCQSVIQRRRIRRITWLAAISYFATRTQATRYMIIVSSVTII